MKQPRGGAAGDLFLFIFFLIVLGIVWALTGGPARPISTSGPFLQNPFGNRNPDTVPGVTLPEGVNTGGGSSSPTPSPSGLLSTERFSPYAGLVRLSAGRAKSSTASEEYVKLQASDTFTNPIAISSWRLESTVSGNGTPLGTAVALPYTGQVNQAGPLFLYPDAELYVTSGRSPIGYSFRTNLCTGYLAQNQNFEPSIRKDCPTAEDELSLQTDFSPNSGCSDFVDSVRRCTFSTGQVPSAAGSECLAFVQNRLTYNGCVNAHAGDSAFYKNEWRVFLNRNGELWKNSNERIRLVDENGFVVDFVSY